MSPETDAELETATKTATVVPPHGNGRLLPGGQYGNPGGGRPKLKVRQEAAAGTSKAQKVLMQMLEAHESGTEKLRPNEVTNIHGALARIGVGELQGQIVLQSEEWLECIEDVLAEQVESSVIQPSTAIGILESVRAKVKALESGDL